jgi:hypothetical protein
VNINTLKISASDSLLYEGRVEFEFQLSYDGPLHSSQNTGRREQKHAIRKRFHPQLAKVWKRLHPQAESDILSRFSAAYGSGPEYIERSSFRFCPIVRTSERLVCELDILFIRRELPGRVITGGDLDNRIKTLFDALRVPDPQQMTGVQPDFGEDPFYCLVEDDALITALAITTAQNLEDASSSSEEKHVRLVLKVKLKRIGISSTDIPELL